MTMENYSIDQLMLFIGGCAAALTTLLLATQKSKCSKVKLCCGLMDCDRDVKAVVQTEQLAINGKIVNSGLTPIPRVSPVVPLNLELKEPEPETDNKL